jgi:tetratricopeptide (TPR) repeat protein
MKTCFAPAALSKLLLVLLFLFTPLSASADWVEAKSDNFVFTGDVSEKRAEKILSELEEYRAIIFTLFQVEPANETVPVRVYATKSGRDIEDMTGAKNAAGVYASRLENPLFILNVKGGFTDKSPAKTIALHEYTHHLLSQYTDQMYPRWVNEGMAEYLSTFRASDKGRVKIGLPKDGRGWTLANYEWMDWDILTSAIRRYPYPNSSDRNVEAVQGLFYAQSWLAVHYIQSTPDMAQKLSQYVRGVPQTSDPKAYFTKVFGMTPAAFGEELRRYFKRNSYPGRQVTLPDSVSEMTITTRKISDGESKFHKAEAIRQFRSHSKEGRALAEEYYDEAESEGGPIARIEASRALIAIQAGGMDDAQAHIDKARSLDPEGARTLHIAGKVAYARYIDYDTPSTSQDMEDARDMFVSAMRAEPTNMQAHYDYVATYAETGDTPSKQAVYSAKECTYHYRSADLLGESMTLASVLSRAGEVDFARHHFQRAALWAPTVRSRRQAREMLERLE